MVELEFDEKLNICAEEMAKDYDISEETARRIIIDMDLYDIVFDYYEDCFIKRAKEKEQQWEEEYRANRDLYEDDIHGGI